ncbi:MAG TPA: hypothetical protein VM074_00940 [Solimonas sp.]|nr:hypothetical protein [Solimonas sp.]
MNTTTKLVTSAALALMAVGCASNQPGRETSGTASPGLMNRIEQGEFSRYETQACKDSTTTEESARNCGPSK